MGSRTIAVLVPCLLAACGQPAAIQELRGPTMGSRYIVKVVGGPEGPALRALVEQVLQEYDQTFSLWRQDSEIAAVNRQRGDAPFAISPRFRTALELALTVARRSDGAFDPTVRPLSALWQRQRNGGRPPTEAEWSAARSRVGWQRLRLDAAGLRKPADQELDLDGLVAGVCADELGGRLRAAGASAGMLDITGEILCFGRKPGGEVWEIGLPGADGDAAVPVVRLLDQALCTSGIRENSLEQDGVTRSHIFDPRTGDNVVHEVVAVSVLTRSCGLADALDTALMVVGPGGAERVLDGWEEQLGALFLLRRPDGSLVRRAVRWPPEKK